MAFLMDESTRLLIQGITGREGRARTRFMLDYGQQVAGGTSPGKGGEEVHNVPVFDTVKEAIEEVGPIDASVTFIPGPAVKDAAIEALEEGIKKIFMPVERVPLHDTLEMVAKAREEDAIIVEPGSIGVISPGKGVAGWLGGTDEAAREAFKAGPVAVLSRSGGQTTTVAWSLVKEGLGVSTAVHIGTEPIIGTTLPEYLPMCEEDDETKAVAIYGEIGGVAEQEVAEFVKKGVITKPLVAYIAGGQLPSGIRFSHASAIVQAGADTYEAKRKLLEESGIKVVDEAKEIAPTIAEVLKEEV